MKTMLILVICMFGILIAIPNFAANNEIGTYLNYSNDVDDVTKYEGAIGYTRHFSKRQHITTKVGNTEYIENKKGIDFTFIELSGRKNLNNLFYLNGGIRYNAGNYDNLIYNFSAVFEKENTARVELFSEKTPIDTHLAIKKELFFTTYGISADYNILNDLILTGVLFIQNSNDDNQRTAELLQLMYFPEYAKGIYLKGKAAFKQGKFDPTEYFMPKDFKRYDILIGYSSGDLFKNFGGKVELGPGLQYINYIEESAFEYRVSLYGWITSSVKIEASYNSTMDNGSEHYNYDWATLNLKYFW